MRKHLQLIELLEDAHKSRNASYPLILSHEERYVISAFLQTLIKLLSLHRAILLHKIHRNWRSGILLQVVGIVLPHHLETVKQFINKKRKTITHASAFP